MDKFPYESQERLQVQLFRKSTDSPFCVRNRFVDKQNWEIIAKSVKFENGLFSADIYDATYETNLNLSIKLSDTEIFRVLIKPAKQESFPRYSVSNNEYIVNQTLFGSNIAAKFNQTESQSIIEYNGSKITVNHKPFSITLQDAKGDAIVANIDDKAIFEQNRDRAKYPKLFESNEFRNFKDDFKNGPTSVAISFGFIGSNNHLSGLASHTLPLCLEDTVNSEPLRFYNEDLCYYNLNSPMGMYGCIPFVFAHSDKHSSGLFWANSSDTYADVENFKDKSNLRLISEGGYIDFYFFTGSNKEITAKYTTLTGRPFLMPRFAFGYHQCRWSYKTEEDFRTTSQKLDEFGVPHDVMWLDIDYTDGKRYFTWDEQAFPTHDKMIEDFAQKHRKIVKIIDPHIKVDENYKLYKECVEKGLFIKSKDGKDFIGQCWPGLSSWPDYLNEETQKWWMSQYANTQPNVHIWNDMNEISCFEGPETSIPRDCLHVNGIEEREVHNIYGHMHCTFTHKGLLFRNIRPFVLTRSFFAGTQRYSAVWTGDNQCSYRYLRAAVHMVLQYGLCGITFSGSDVGGFFNNSPDDKLLARWHQVCAWTLPFFREHVKEDADRREIYIRKDEHYKNLMKESVLERYQMTPYWYTLMKISNETGLPITRPLFLEFENNEYAKIEDEVMVGSGLLVVPFFDENAKTVEFVLPKESKFYDFRTLQPITSNVAEYDEGRAKVLIRAGNIVPMKQKTAPTTFEMEKFPLTLVIAVDEAGKASGKFYDDDGESLVLNNSVYREFVFSNNKLENKSLNESEFSKKYEVVVEEIRIVGLHRPAKAVCGGKQLDFVSQDNTIILENLALPVSQSWTIEF